MLDLITNKALTNGASIELCPIWTICFASASDLFYGSAAYDLRSTSSFFA